MESGEEIRVRDNIITELEERNGIKQGTIQIAVAVETALGVIKAFEIASTSPRVVSLGIGA